MLTFLVGGLMERYHVEDLDFCGKIILKRIFWKWNEEAGTGLLWLRIGTDGRSL
jgi:hypothetical protein